MHCTLVNILRESNEKLGDSSKSPNTVEYWGKPELKIVDCTP